MKIKPVFYQGIDCLDILLISYAKYLNRDIEIIFANMWDFRFNPDVETFSDSFGVEESSLTQSQYQLLGLNIDFFLIEDFKNFIQFLKKMLKKNRPIGLSIDSFHCPWHARFKIDHGKHYILALDFSDDEIICIDPGFNNQGIEKLPIRLLEKGYEWYFTLQDIGSINSPNYSKSYMESIKRLETLDIPTKIEAFSHHFKQHFDYTSECKDILFNPWASQIFQNFITIVGGRRQFIQYLKFMKSHEVVINNYEDIVKSFQKVCSKWDIIRWLFVKSTPETFNEKYCSKIGEMLLGIAEDESLIIKMLTNETTPKNDVDKVVFSKKPVKKSNIHQIKLDKLLNNKAFSIQGEHTADLTGLSEWCIYNLDLEKEIDLLSKEFRLYMNKDNKLDNVTCLGQKIKIPPNIYTELNILATADFEDFVTIIEIFTVDDRRFDLEFSCNCWVDSKIEITDKPKLSFLRSHQNPDGSIDLYEDKGNIYQYKIPILVEQQILEIVLPLCPNIHIFAINLISKT